MNSKTSHGGGPALYSTWAYTLVDAPRWVEFVHNMSDEDGTTIDAEGIPRMSAT